MTAYMYWRREVNVKKIPLVRRKAIAYQAEKI